MIVTRKEKETNQQVLRRFNRAVLNTNFLQKARDLKEYTKSPNRHAIQRSAVRRESLRRTRQWY
jgi:ribosomal protein S21